MKEVPMQQPPTGPLKPEGCTCQYKVFGNGQVQVGGQEDCAVHGPAAVVSRATPEECVLIHHFLTGHDCGGGGGYADCKCGREWHYPISAEEQAEYEQGRKELDARE